jgi:lipopolysaccharide export LptBFGC system permease protein LptF
VPASNQSVRTAALGRPIAPGPAELSFGTAQRNIAGLREYVGSEKRLRLLEFTYHSRLSLVLTPVSAMLLALAFACRRKAKRHPYRTGLLTWLAYGAFIAFARGFAIASLSRGSGSPGVLAWGPFIALTFCGAIALYFSATATPGKPWTMLPPAGSSNDLIS